MTHSDVSTGARTSPRAMVIGSLGYSLVNFRLDLMRRLQSNGFDVMGLAADIDDQTARDLKANGIQPIEVPMDRTGTNPVKDLNTLRALVSIMRREKPDLVIAYTMKPIIYGCLAAQLARVPARYAMFTGLGYGFMEEAPTGRRKKVRDLSIWLHRVALRRIHGAFCYNAADRKDIRRFRLIPDRIDLVDVPGSGVDTSRFVDTPVPTERVKFLFVGRLLRSKGLQVLGDAAELLQQRGLDCDIEVLGPSDSNPDAIEPETLEDWQNRGLITCLGETRDVRPYLSGCTVFVLPTQLREGIPRSILEAMASGRAVITTDAPGCGEAIQDGVTGMVVPRGNAEALAQTMARFIEDPKLAVQMGKAARELACNTYDVHKVNTVLMQNMGVEEKTEARVTTARYAGQAAT